MTATYDDANLLLQLIIWGQNSGTPASVMGVWSDDYDPASTDDNEHASKILGFFEVVGTLVKQNVLDAGLVYDMWTVKALWQRVETRALHQRERSGEPRIWENFERLAAHEPS